MMESLESCLMCGSSADTLKCADQDCLTHLHRGCAYAECEGCGQVVCEEHVRYIDDTPACTGCIENLELLNGREIGGRKANQ